MKIDHAAILAGGLGTRLGEITKKTPKPLIKINNIEFIKYLIFDLVKNNFKKIIILTCYKSKKFKDQFDKLNFSNVKIICVDEKKPLGTGGSIAQLKKYKKNFLVLNGDSYINFNYQKFLKLKKSSLAKILLVKNYNYKSNKKLSNLNLNKNSYVIYSKDKYMNAGIYIFKKKLLDKFKISNNSLENNLLPNLINKRKVEGMTCENDFIDIGLKKNLVKSSLFFKKVFKLRAVLFDRDGTLNKNYGYVFKFAKFKWLKGSIEALKFLKFLNVKILVVTNQSGIGRGLYTKKDFYKLNRLINKNLKIHKTKIDKFYFAPYYKFSKNKNFRKNKNLRKPNNGMLMRALKDYKISRKNCFMIGDKKSDLLAAKKTKIIFYKKKNSSLFNQIIKNLNDFNYS